MLGTDGDYPADCPKDKFESWDRTLQKTSRKKSHRKTYFT